MQWLGAVMLWDIRVGRDGHESKFARSGLFYFVDANSSPNTSLSEAELGRAPILDRPGRAQSGQNQTPRLARLAQPHCAALHARILA